MAYDLSDFEVAESPVAVKSPPSRSAQDLSDFEVEEDQKILPTGVPELPYPEGLERGVQKSVTKGDISEAPEASAPLSEQAKAWFSVDKNPIINRLASTGLKTAAGAEFARAQLMPDDVRKRTIALADSKRMYGGEPDMQDELGTERRAIHKQEVQEKRQAEKEAGEFSEAAQEKEEASPKGALTSIGKGIGSGLAMFAETGAGGIPLLATTGATEAYGSAKAAGKSDEQADHDAARALLALTVFGGANKAVSSGITKYLGKDAPALQSFLVQSLGQSAGNELTSRLISSYEAALDAPEGEKVKAAADAAKKFNLESTTQNIAFGVAGGAGALKGKPEDYHINKAPDEVLHEVAAHPEFSKTNPAFSDAAKEELSSRADAIRNEVAPVLPRLPGGVQERVNTIIDKQASGQPLTTDEQATLIQVRSYASKVGQDQSNAEFTGATGQPQPTGQAATAKPAETGGPLVSPRSETPTEPIAEQPKVYTPRIREAAAVTEPLKEAASEAKTTLPAAANAAEELANVVEQKVSSPQPKVEAPSKTGELISLTAEQERAPAEETQPATETAAVKPVDDNAFFRDGTVIADESQQPKTGTRIVGPVLQVDGKTYAEGKVGQQHKDIVAEAIDNYFKANPDAQEVPRFDHKFKDDKGNIHDRESGWEVAKNAKQIPQETVDSAEAFASSSGDKPQLHADHLIKDEIPTSTPSEEPTAVERPMETPARTVERPDTETHAKTEAPKLIDKLESILAEEEPTEAEKPTKSDAQKRVDAIRQDIENNKDADNAWKSRRRKDLKAAEEALKADQGAAPTGAEPAKKEKEIWEKTRDEVKEEGGSLAKHRNAVKEAISQGKDVPLNVLESFSGNHWADKVRKEKYGERVSDTLIDKILNSLKDENGNLYFDPLFMQSVGKPALRGAVKLIREGIEAGRVAKDVMTDVVNYIKKNAANADEQKTRDFFQPIIDEALGKEEAKTAETATEQPQPEAQKTPESQRLTSTKNAVVDAERKARGEPELMSEAKKSLGDTWDEAMKRLEVDPSASTDLVSELRKKPRAINAVEEALLLHHKVDVMNELAKSTEIALDENAAPEDRITSRVRADYLMDELNSIDEATKKAGTEWGRTGRFRQMLAAEDYSLVRMIQKSEMAKGRKLTEEEQAKVQKMSERIADLEKQLAEHEKNRESDRERMRNEEMDKAIKSMASKSETPADAYSKSILERIQGTLKNEADKARQRIRERLGKASALVDPVVVYDVAVIGAEKLFSVGLDFARWSSEMLSDLGESFKPYITQETFEQSKKINDEAIEKAPKKVRDKIKPKAPKADKTIEEKRDAIVQSIKSRAGANESVGRWIQKLAETFVGEGITERDALVKAVHGAVKDALPESTPRDIRDAISGYGDYKELNKDEVKVKLRDLKGQMQQVSKLEDMLEKGELPKKTGVQRREPSAEERQLLKEVNRVKKELGLESADPDRLKGALDAAKTRAKNRIEDLQRAIEKKEKIPKSDKKLVEDDELRDLKAQRDALQKEYDEVFATPKKTPEEIALAAYKSRTQKRIDELNERLKNGDFSKKPRKTIELDKEGQKLKSEAERVKLDFDRANYKEKMKNRTWMEKALDTIPKYERAFLLSNPITIAKLTAAAAWRMGITPMEELVGAGLGKLPFVSEIASRAPREGGLNSKAEAKAITEAFTTGLKDAFEKLKRGETKLDVTGGKRNIIPHEWIDFFGNIHGALKAPVVRAEFARSFEKRADFYARNGVDITDPMVQARIGVEAYRDSQKAIFQQDNRVVQIYNTALRQLEQPSKETGRTSLGNKAIQATAKTLFPIVKIPTNIVAEAMQYATGTITGSARVAAAFKRGVSTLKPEEADLIMRELKKGSLGGAVMLLGFLAPQVIGGFYQHGKKRDENDVKAGHVKLYGHDIPPFLLHAPAIEMLQVGSTIRRVADSNLRKRDTDTQGVGAGVTAAALGLIDEVPFVRDTAQLSKLFNPYERIDYLGELARSRMEPQLIQWIAQQTDRDRLIPPSEIRQRKAESIGENLKLGVPGLREQVPLKEGKRSSGPRRSPYKRTWK